MIRVAIVGAGNIGNTHGRCYQKNKDAQIVGVCDVIKEKAQAAGKAFGCPGFASVAEMLAAVKVDAASVTTAGAENGADHYAPTMELLRGGVAVLGEKPISNKIPQAREMVALAQEKRLAYGINLNHRFTPAARRAKQWLSEGRLGEVNLLNMTLWINNPNESAPHFHMRALHPHSIDVMRYFAGDVRKVQAFFKKGPGRAVWSNVQVNMLFASGAVGHLTGSYDAGGAYGLEMCEIVGSKARVTIHDACEKLVFHPRANKEVESYDFLGGMMGFGETFQARIDAWIADLVKKTPIDEVDGKAQDALAAQLVIEAAIQSWETDTVVTLDA